MIYQYLMDYAANKVKAEKDLKGLCNTHLMGMCHSTQSRLEIKDGKWKFVHKTGNAVDEYIVEHALPTDPELRRLVDCVKNFVNIANEVKDTHGVDVWEYITDVTPDNWDEELRRKESLDGRR